MDWNKIVHDVSKAVESAQTMVEMAIDVTQKAVKCVDVVKGASGIIQGEDSVAAKGIRLVEFANSAFDDSVKNATTSYAEYVAERPDCDSSYSQPEESQVHLPVELSTPTDAVAALALMGTEIAKTVQFCQAEETKRAEINARMEVEVTRINSITKLLSDYLNKTFDERAELFDNYFSVLDKALERSDSSLVAQTLQSINLLAASSPFKDLADLNKVSSMLSEGGEWDI